MRKEVLSTENTDLYLGAARYGTVKDVAKQARNRAQNAGTDSFHLSACERKRPEPLSLVARPFQLELYQRAMLRNTIAVLDTGTGKTYIASLLIRDTLYLEKKKRTYNDNLTSDTRIVFFLVDKVALATQQAEFLQKTCPGRIGVLFGALGVDSFSKAQWVEVYKQYDVVVLTADILKNCLARGFVNMTSIILLIFDECHHARKAHPYALIQQFYHGTTVTSRPRIFGMTASPVSSNGRQDLVLAELERILDAQICLPDLESLHGAVVRPQEYLSFYEQQEPRQLDLTWMDELHTLLTPIKSMKKGLRNAAESAQELGEWAIAHVCRLILDDTQWRYHTKTKMHDLNNIAEHQNRLRLVEAQLAARRPWSIDECKRSMTPKVQKLLSILNSIYRTAIENDLNAPVVLVFCEKRITAYLLMVLCSTILHEELPTSFRCSLFIGHGTSEEGDVSMTAQRQNLVMDAFRYHEVNCLFVTSVAEEGIDVPACEYVIRYDHLTSVTQYIQSRGRARKSTSSYITLMEEGDTTSLAEHKHIKECEEVVRILCRSLDRNADLAKANFERDEDNGQENVDPSMNGGAPSFAALSIVEGFCRSLPADEFVSLKPVYEIRNVENMGFVAVCKLPPVSEVPPVLGNCCKSKRDAKADAALIVVSELLQRGLIDNFYNPRTIQHVLQPPTDNCSEEFEDDQEVRNLLESAEDKKEWPRRDPAFWHRSSNENDYYITRLITDKAELYNGTLLLITKGSPLPPIQPMTFSHQDQEFSITCVNLSDKVQFSASQLDILLGFTDRLFKVMVNKIFVGSLEHHAYFLAIDTGSESASTAIDWHEMEQSYYDRHQQISARMLHDGMRDSIIKEINRSTYYIVKAVQVQRAQTGTDGPTKCTAKAAFTEAAIPKDCSKIDAPMHVFTSTIIEAVPLKRTLNYLHSHWQATQAATEPNRAKATYLDPRDCVAINMRASVVAMAFLFPSFAMRLDSYLFAKELNTYLGTSIKESLLVEALTTRQANHGCDYERLEFLGDAYLKLITTIAVYLHFKNYHEGLLTMQRTMILENKNLMKLAIRRKLYQSIRSQCFSKSSWRPPHLLLEHEDQMPEMTHRLSNKQIADVMEAILGAAVLDGGFDVGLKAAAALGIETYAISTWNMARKKFNDTLPQFLFRSRVVPGREDIESTFQYTFKRPGLLEQALRHGSCPLDSQDPMPSYQRLEFVGDAVLEIEVAFWLFRTFPEYSPNRMTMMKSHLVRNKSLGALLESLGLHRHMRHFNSAIPGAMAAFSDQLAILKKRAAKSDYYNDCDPPKFMSDILEAILGAIYLDNMLDTQPIRNIFQSHFLTRLDPDIDYSRKRPEMETLVHLLQKSGCTEAVLMKSETTKNISLNHRIVHKNVQPEKVVALGLKIHNHDLCHVKAPSYGLAKLKLAEVAVRLLVDEQADLIERICDCSTNRKVVDHGTEESQFSF